MPPEAPGRVTLERARDVGAVTADSAAGDARAAGPAITAGTATAANSPDLPLLGGEGHIYDIYDGPSPA
jgi:hypothetical protein